MRTIISLLKKAFDSIENTNYSIWYFFFLFLCIVTLRNFLEFWTYKTNFVYFLSENLFLFYLSSVLSFVILIDISIPGKITKILKTVFTSFIIVFLAPIIDSLIYFGNPPTIGYIEINSINELAYRFFHFFGPSLSGGISIGIKIEFSVFLAALFSYLYINKQKIFKCISYTFFGYCIFFLYSIDIFSFSNIFKVIKMDVFKDLYLILIAFQSTYICYRIDRVFFKDILKDIRLLRISHFLLMIPIGFLFARLENNIIALPKDNLWAFSCILLIPSLMLAFVFSIITNNIADINIDTVSNKNRPSIRNSIPFDKYKKIPWIILPISLFYAISIDFKSFNTVLFFISSYFLYSMPPLRLKRIPVISKMFIALNSMILFLYGYSYPANVFRMPKLYVLFFIIPFFLALNFIDLKDEAGDMAAGIKTIPVLIGMRKAQYLIAVFWAAAYAPLLLIFTNIYERAAFVFLYILSAIFLIKKNYNEKPLFIVYLSTLLFIIILLLINWHGTGFHLALPKHYK